MKRAILLAGVLFFIFASAAQAEPFSPEVEAYYANAIQYWGHEPPRCKTITKEAWQGSLAQSSPESEVIGRATQPRPEQGIINCRITIDVAREPWMVCRTVMHEVGHLEGVGHSGEPTNIMYPRISREAIAPGCPEPPSVEGYLPQEPISNLNIAYSRWQNEVARCNNIAAHSSPRRAAYCWEMARLSRWAYEEESSKY